MVIRFLLRMKKNTYNIIKKEAAKQERSMNWLINRLLEQALEKKGE